MKIVVTGVKGFIGRNLVEASKNIRYEKDTSKKAMRGIHIRYR